MNKVKDLRKSAKITQEELSKKSGVSRTTISAIENGNDSSASQRTMTAIADAFGKKVRNIFFLNNV